MSLVIAVASKHKAHCVYPAATFHNVPLEVASFGSPAVTSGYNLETENGPSLTSGRAL